MAVDMTTGSGKAYPANGTGGNHNVLIPVKWADALAAKASALAAADILEIMDIPVACWINTGTVHANIAATGVTTLTVDLGVAGADEWVNGFDVVAAAVATAIDAKTWFGATDTLDLTIKTLAGTLYNGSVNVVINVTPLYEGILASLK